MDETKSLTFVLFGATGDLAQRKIMPALCELFCKNIFPKDSVVIVYSRRPWQDSDYHSFITPSLQSFSSADINSFLSHVRYVQGTFDDPASFAILKDRIKTNQTIFHLAVQPEFHTQIIEGVGGAGLRGTVLIEKPFGHDRASAVALENSIELYTEPKDIFRIDHYLGKAGLDAFFKQRKTDSTFETRLTNAQVASITCRILEKIDIQGRGELYDSLGALRDVGQSHLLSMLSMLLMNLEDAENFLPHARAEALRQLVTEATPGEILKGQYEGYTNESGVKKDSQTETHFQIHAYSSDSRWSGVPITLEAGKALKEKKSEIEIVFKDGTRSVFDMEVPTTPGSYETILAAALVGDQARFVSLEEVLASWDFIASIEKQFVATPLHIYKKGVDSLQV